MRKKFTYILLATLMSGALTSSCISGPIAIRFYDQTLFTIRHVETEQSDLRHWAMNPDPLKSMFSIYQLPTSLEAYKSVFLDGQYPSHIDEVYDAWMAQMKSVSITTEAIFYGELNLRETACIQFRMTQDGISFQMSFLAKRIAGHWYPLDTRENAQYQHVAGFFGTFSPEFAAALIAPDKPSSFQQAAFELLETCRYNDNQLTESCIYNVAEKWFAGDPASRIRESMLFKDRMTRDTETAGHESFQHSLQEFVLSLSLSEETSSRALYYFLKHESLKAVQVLYQSGLEMDQQSLFMEINRIFQNSAMRTFNYEFAEKPNTN